MTIERMIHDYAAHGGDVGNLTVTVETDRGTTIAVAGYTRET